VPRSSVTATCQYWYPAIQVLLEDGIEVLGRHVDELLVAQDAGVVDEDVAAAPGVDRGLDDLAGRVELGHAVVARHRLAAEVRDLLANDGGRVGVRAATVRGAADVVDDHPGAFTCQRHRHAPADAPAGAGDDRDFALEQLAHANASESRSCVTPSSPRRAAG